MHLFFVAAFLIRTITSFVCLQVEDMVTFCQGLYGWCGHVHSYLVTKQLLTLKVFLNTKFKEIFIFFKKNHFKIKFPQRDFACYSCVTLPVCFRFHRQMVQVFFPNRNFTIGGLIK
jgi:hypothetical protein